MFGKNESSMKGSQRARKTKENHHANPNFSGRIAHVMHTQGRHALEMADLLPLIGILAPIFCMQVEG
jgi:hypothetical protein